jgi:hypothetical protein
MDASPAVDSTRLPHLVDLVEVAVARDSLVKAAVLERRQQQALLLVHVRQRHLCVHVRVCFSCSCACSRVCVCVLWSFGTSELQQLGPRVVWLPAFPSGASLRTHTINHPPTQPTWRIVRKTTMECTPHDSTRRLNTAGTRKGDSL